MRFHADEQGISIGDALFFWIVICCTAVAVRRGMEYNGNITSEGAVA